MVLLPLIALILSFATRANLLVSTLLFFGLPSIWFSYRRNQAIRKTLLFSLFFSIPFTLVIDYVLASSEGWFIVNTVFPFRLFGVVAIEQFIWAFLFVYFIIIFYEHFLDRDEKKSVSRRVKYFFGIVAVILVVFFLLLFINPVLLQIKYSYLVLAVILLLVPLIVFLFRFPNLLSKFIKITIYFFALAILVELTGLGLGHWTFPGTYSIAWFGFFGHRVPVEEVIFYMIMATAGVLSYYEFFADDRK